MDPLEELVRLQVWALRKSLPTQAATIAELHGAGLKDDRIAELLGTTVATVKSSLQKAALRAKKESGSE
jgi:DNA-directed RNA polymerase specialized sigma24 family protein